jgi:spermidine/putrescine transport system permease protein
MRFNFFNTVQHDSRMPRSMAGLLAFPGAAWIALFLLLPLLFVLGISFFSTGSYGEIERPLTLEHYLRFFGFGEFAWEPLYPAILGRSLWLAAAATSACFVLALPMAFFIAGLPTRWKSAALILLTIPLWTNLLIRTYAWQMVLGAQSPLGRLWSFVGGNPDALYPGTFAVYAGLVCDYLPFLVLPLYASVEKIDWTLAEAAMDLGASRWNTARHAIWPQIRPGAIAGITLVLVPATGQFVIPDLLGGARTVLLGNVIQQQFGPSQNWPFGSAVSTIAMLVVLAGIYISMRTQRSSTRREGNTFQATPTA